jgi:tryptophan-rich sensory protein
MKNIWKLIISIIICELAGIIGSLFTMPSIPTWYAGLGKPALNPPAWVFGPVWTTLFVLMGIALWLVWINRSADKKAKKTAIVIFFIQLALNTLWSIIFFGWHSPGWSFVDLVFLWLAILTTIILFAKVFKPAAWLLVPYILWVSFAGYLNFAIWQNQTAEPSAPTVPDTWLTATATSTPLSFRYPADLGTTYIRAQTWPPQIQVLDQAFTCTEAGTTTAQGGQTSLQSFHGHEYCVTKESEGAAGSIYTTDTYAFARNQQTITLTFTLQSPQCANYDDPKKTECQNEEDSFDVNGLVDQMAGSVKTQP